MVVGMFKRQIPSTSLSLWKHQRRIFTSHELYQNRGRVGSRPILVSLHLPQTRSSWLNCALRDDEAVYWVSIGHYEAVAVGN